MKNWNLKENNFQKYYNQLKLKLKTKMNKKILLYICVFTLFLFSSYAYTEYTQLGGDDGYYNTDNTRFNNELDINDVVSTTRPLTNPSYQPYVKDLNGDGNKEIIVLDDTELNIYDDELNIIDGVSLYNNIYSNIEIHQIDGQTNYSIILAHNTDTNIINITRYTFDGTSILLVSTDNLSTSLTPRDMVLKCGYTVNVDNCLLISEHFTSPSLTNLLLTTVWNSTGITESKNYKSETDVKNCLPSIPQIVLTDYDNDATLEYIFSYFSLDGSNPTWENNGIIDILYTNLTNEINFEQSILRETGANTFATTVTCQDPLSVLNLMSPSNYITSPIVFNFDGKVSNGNEIIIGLAVDLDLADSDFKLYSFKANGDLLDDYPEVFDADGFLISNPVRMNAFTDTDGNDVCVMGFDYNTDRLDLLCASEQTGFFGAESHEFFYYGENNIGVEYNLSFDTENNHVYHLIHAVDSNSHIENGINLDDILTSYGTFYLDYTGSIDRLRLSYAIPQENVAVIPIDLYDDDNNQLLFYTDTNIWLYTDGFINKGCGDIGNNCIKEGGSINPSSDATWKINTSLEVVLALKDLDNDKISGRVYLYYGDNNQQLSNWTAFFNSGTSLTFSDLVVNKTITNGILRIEARDEVNPLTVQLLELSFSVAETGIEFGDAIFYFGESDEVVEVEEDLIVEDTDDYLTSNIKLGASYLKIKKSVMTFIALVLIATLLSFFFIKGFELKPTHSGTIIVFVVMLFITSFIFTLMELVSSSLYITMFVLMLFVIAITMSGLFKSSTG